MRRLGGMHGGVVYRTPFELHFGEEGRGGPLCASLDKAFVVGPIIAIQRSTCRTFTKWNASEDIHGRFNDHVPSTLIISRSPRVDNSQSIPRWVAVLPEFQAEAAEIAKELVDDRVAFGKNICCEASIWVSALKVYVHAAPNTSSISARIIFGRSLLKLLFL